MSRKLSVSIFLVTTAVICWQAQHLIYRQANRPPYEKFMFWTDLVIKSELDGMLTLSEAELDEKDRAYRFVATSCPNLAKHLRETRRSKASCMMMQMIDAMDFGYFDHNQTFTPQEEHSR